jgi:hypothetical protein
MILAVASDSRFQQQSGYIFTEIGAATLQPYLESFLMDDQLSDQQVTEKLRHVAWNIGHGGLWEKTNFYDFLRKIHSLNRSLPRERRVHVCPTDGDFDWENATKESWAEQRRTLESRRDQIMADHVISKFNEIRQAGSRNKALVIMNWRHAFPHLKGKDGKTFRNATGFLMDAYPGLVANVMINSLVPLPGIGDQGGQYTAAQKGKWDAAFVVLGNPDLGFDFKGSPLGEDAFDNWSFFPTDLRYQDVFTGFVFFKPLDAHRQSFGFPPGVLDQAFGDELVRRIRIMGGNANKDEIEQGLGTVQIANDYKMRGVKSDYKEKIQQWLKVKP